MKDEEKAMSAKNRSRLRLQNPETAEPSKTKDLRDAIIFDRTQPNPDTRLSDKETPPSQKLKEAIIFNNLEDTEKSPLFLTIQRTKGSVIIRILSRKD